MKFLPLLAVLVLSLATAIAAPAKAQPRPFDFDGTIAAISETSVTVKGAKTTRTFAVHPGTVFGQRAKAALADFKPGDHVIVVFSEEVGKAKAENIRNPANDKVKAAAKPKAK